MVQTKELRALGEPALLGRCHDNFQRFVTVGNGKKKEEKKIKYERDDSLTTPVCYTHFSPMSALGGSAGQKRL